MKLWLISQDQNTEYDTYDSAVVAAETELDAKNTTPDGGGFTNVWGTWAKSPDKVRVEYLGVAKPGTKPGVICASYNAG